MNRCKPEKKDTEECVKELKLILPSWTKEGSQTGKQKVES